MVEHTSPEAAQDVHLRLMSLIEQHPDHSQRRLAEAMVCSLGKVHYLLKALLDQGWVRSGRSMGNPGQARYVYALTPAGVEHRLQLTHRFLQMKEQAVTNLKSEIEQLRAVLDADVTQTALRSGDRPR